jgi:hypothetical protein
VRLKTAVPRRFPVQPRRSCRRTMDHACGPFKRRTAGTTNAVLGGPRAWAGQKTPSCRCMVHVGGPNGPGRSFPRFSWVYTVEQFTLQM